MPTSSLHRDPFDVIVIGMGAMGSAACCELARRGCRVLGLEQFNLGHDRGSAHGETRITRKAYFEHPDYVPLLKQSYEGWYELERVTGRKLLQLTGLVLSGDPSGPTISGARLSAKQHQLELLNYTAKEAAQRFPGLSFPADHEVAFEPGAGTLFVEECVRAHIDQAIQYGAAVQSNQKVIEWTSDGDRVHVKTDSAEYTAQKLVITAGAWASQTLRDVGVKFDVLRKFVGWFPTSDPACQASNGMPTFFYELGDNAFYGFPSFDGKTVKVAEHSGGQPVSNPLVVDRNCHPEDHQRLGTFLKDHLPKVSLEIARHSVCFYTMTSDQHFVVDLHHRWSNVSFAAGFSGHGFKFCPVIGQALADLAEQRKTALPIGFLSASRPGLGRS